jgi:hypothetical protein
MVDPSPDDLRQLRAVVQQRLSRRNNVSLIAMFAGYPIPVIAIIASDGVLPAWALLIALLSPAIGMLRWQFNPRREPKVHCPVCGEDWEHDEFLGWRYCEECGLPLPTENAA